MCILEGVPLYRAPIYVGVLRIESMHISPISNQYTNFFFVV